jgi:hypothetical protein
MCLKPDSLIAAALENPATSDWLRNSLRLLPQRDPVDVSNDIEYLKIIADGRLAEILKMSESLTPVSDHASQIRYAICIECTASIIPVVYELQSPSKALADSAKALLAHAFDGSALPLCSVKVVESSLDDEAHTSLSKGLLLEINHVTSLLVKWLPELIDGDLK